MNEVRTTTVRFHSGVDPDIAYNERDASRTFPTSRYDPDGVHESWRGMSEREAYETCFADALASYNAKQKRKDRRMTMDEYMDSVREDKRGRVNKARTKATGTVQRGKHTSYEVIMSVGSCTAPRDEDGVMIRGEAEERLTPHRLPDGVNKAIMQAYVESWDKRNPTLFLYNAQYHADGWFKDNVTDEMIHGIDHVHLAYVPVGHGYARGMDTQSAIGRALNEMGFYDGYEETDAGRTRFVSAYEKWERREREYIEELTAEYAPEWTIDHPYEGMGVDALNVAQYREREDLESEISYERMRIDDLEYENARQRRVNASLRHEAQETEELLDFIEKRVREPVRASEGRMEYGRHSRASFLKVQKTTTGETGEERYQRWKKRQVDKEQAARDKVAETVKPAIAEARKRLQVTLPPDLQAALDREAEEAEEQQTGYDITD